MNKIRMMLYLVTNGTEHAYWNSGHWDSTERFHGKCLLDYDDARDALRDLNNDNGEWFSKEVEIGVANDPPAELAALCARVAELEGAQDVLSRSIWALMNVPDTELIAFRVRMRAALKEVAS